MKLAIVDDNERDRLRLQDQLQSERIAVSVFAPPADLDLTRILEYEADVYLIDYELDAPDEPQVATNYRGPALCAAVRERRPEHPIILLTRDDLKSWNEHQRTIRASRGFDDVLFKEELNRDAKGAARQLEALTAGYEELRSVPEASRTSSALLELLGTDDRGTSLAGEASPPGENWQAFEVSNWIHIELFGHPGVLYDDLFASVALGISLDSFRDPTLQEFLGPAKYSGVFSGGNERWWRHSLMELARQMLDSCGITGPTNQGFIAALQKIHGVDAERSICNTSNESPADTVCFVLHEPVKFEYSLPYHSDRRTLVMDVARVSFKAIHQSDEWDEQYFEPSARTLLDGIRGT